MWLQFSYKKKEKCKVVVVMGQRPLKKTEALSKVKKIHCLCCNKEDESDNYYDSDSLQYRTYGKIPYCTTCIEKMYLEYLAKFKVLNKGDAEKHATQRICMMLDLYYKDSIFESAMEFHKKNVQTSKNSASFIAQYVRFSKMYQYRKKNYFTTIEDDFKKVREEAAEKQGTVLSTFDKSTTETQKKIIQATKIFGEGFPEEDYLWLYDAYQDWTSRHECQTKAQEENFKAICFNRLNAYKANLRGETTKDLDKTFNDLLNTGNLQPKQNKGETIADTQTFGTLIEKWEDTTPIPEVDEELKDVDKLGLFLDVFFRGHLAKFMGLKNGVSKYYDEYMKQFTITKPSKIDGTGNEEVIDDSEAIFDALFGNSTSDKEE